MKALSRPAPNPLRLDLNPFSCLAETSAESYQPLLKTLADGISDSTIPTVSALLTQGETQT